MFILIRSAMTSSSSYPCCTSLLSAYAMTWRTTTTTRRRRRIWSTLKPMKPLKLPSSTAGLYWFKQLWPVYDRWMTAGSYWFKQLWLMNAFIWTKLHRFLSNMEWRGSPVHFRTPVNSRYMTCPLHILFSLMDWWVHLIQRVWENWTSKGNFRSTIQKYGVLFSPQMSSPLLFTYTYFTFYCLRSLKARDLWNFDLLIISFLTPCVGYYAVLPFRRDWEKLLDQKKWLER